MRLDVACAVVFVALAGCANPAPASSPTSTLTPSATLPANLTLIEVHSGYDLTVTQGMLIVERVGQTGNCLAWPGPLRVVHGNATATWRAQTPLAATMEVAAVDSINHVRNAAAGASPRTVKLDGLAPGLDAYAVLQVQVPAPASAAVQQAVHVEVAFTAWAVAAPQPQVTSCSV